MKKRTLQMLMFLLSLTLFMVSCDDDDDDDNSGPLTPPELNGPVSASVSIGQSDVISFDYTLDPAATAVVVAASSNETVLTVSPATTNVTESGSIDVNWTAVNVGSATITITLIDSETAISESSVAVTVTERPTVTLENTSATVVLNTNGAIVFDFTFDPTLTGTITIESSNTSALTVSPASTDVSESGSAEFAWIAVAEGRSDVSITLTDSNNGTVTETIVVDVADLPIANTAIWATDLLIEDVGFGELEGVGVVDTNDPNILIVNANLVNSSLGDGGTCDVAIKLVPNDFGATEGIVEAFASVIIDPTCNEEADGEYMYDVRMGGTYDEERKEITLDYFYVGPDGGDIWPGTNIIRPVPEPIEVIDCSPVNTEIWAGDVNVEDFGFSTFPGMVTQNPDDCTQLTFLGVNLPNSQLGSTVTPCDVTISLVPDADGATTGTVTPGQFTIFSSECGGQTEFVLVWEVVSGTYDESAGTITIEYDYIDTADGTSIYTGTNVITPASGGRFMSVPKEELIKERSLSSSDPKLKALK